MVDACLAAGAHYVDVTGEVRVFEAVLGRHAEAAAAGVILLPGAGFDVVPTDCLAGLLAAALPDAVTLELAFVVGRREQPRHRHHRPRRDRGAAACGGSAENWSRRRSGARAGPCRSRRVPARSAR